MVKNLLKAVLFTTACYTFLQSTTITQNCVAMEESSSDDEMDTPQPVNEHQQMFLANIDNLLYQIHAITSEYYTNEKLCSKLMKISKKIVDLQKYYEYIQDKN